MGHGSWTARAYSTYASTTGYTDKSVHEVFSSRAVNKALNPFGVTVRESRDSAEHPNSIPIILGLDVTGSMGYLRSRDCRNASTQANEWHP